MVIFYKNLKAWRFFKGFTQEELSQRSGVSRPNLVALEQGRRECTLSTLNRLAYALGISPGRLLDEQPLEKPFTKINRHEIDLVARSLLNRSVSLPSDLLMLKQQVLAQAGPLLRVAGIKGTSKLNKINPLYDEVAGRVLERVSKLV